MNLPLPDVGAATNLKVASLSLKDFVTHLVPSSIFKAMADNEILQIVIFSLFFGVACAALGDRAHTIVHGIEELSHVILKLTGYIMGLAPLAVFASMAAIVTTQRTRVSWSPMASSSWEFYVGLLLLWCLLVLVGFGFFGRHIFRLIGLVREPFLLAFSTASKRGRLSQDDGGNWFRFPGHS